MGPPPGCWLDAWGKRPRTMTAALPLGGRESAREGEDATHCPCCGSCRRFHSQREPSRLRGSPGSSAGAPSQVHARVRPTTAAGGWCAQTKSNSGQPENAHSTGTGKSQSTSSRVRRWCPFAACDKTKIRVGAAGPTPTTCGRRVSANVEREKKPFEWTRTGKCRLWGVGNAIRCGRKECNWVKRPGGYRHASPVRWSSGGHRRVLRGRVLFVRPPGPGALREPHTREWVRAVGAGRTGRAVAR